MIQRCRTCQLDKSIHDFHVRSDTGRRRPVCKTCWKVKGMRWAAANPAKRRAISLKWAKAHYPYIRAKKAEYRKRDPLRMRRWSLENPELKKAMNRRWCQNNRGKVTASTRARQLAKIQATPKWANRYIIGLIYQLAAAFRMQVDHIIPLRHPLVCGLHVEDNLQLLTQSENARKRNSFTPC